MPNPAVYIDWDLDNYASPYADITTYVKEFRTERGLAAFEHLTDDTFFSITLYNDDLRFSPENYASPLFTKLRNDIPIKIVFDSVQIETAYTESFEPTPHRFGDRLCRLRCTGVITRLRKSDADLRIYRDVKPGEVLRDIFISVPPPIRPVTGMRLGVVGYSQLDVDAYLADQTDFVDFDLTDDYPYGIDTISIIGHNVKPDTFGKYDLASVANDCITRDMGLVWQAQDGKMTMRNRRSWVLNETVDVSVDGTANQPPFYTTPRQEFVARTVVTGEEIIEAIDTILWELGNPITFGGSETKIIYAEPTDGGKKISADAIRTPVGNDVNWSSGSGSISVFQSSQKIGLKITAGTFGGTLSTLKLRGTEIDTNTFTVQSENDDLLGIYEPQTITRKVKLLQDPTQAQYYSDWLLYQRSKEVGRIEDLTFIRGAAELSSTSDMIANDIGAVVEFTDLQLRHYRKYRVIRVARQWSNETLTTTWGLLPSPKEALFITDSNRLNFDTVLGY